MDDQNIPDKNEVLSYALTPKNCPGLGYPIVLNSQGSPVCSNGTQSPSAEQRNRQDSYVTQWGLSIEQALPGNFVANMAYVGSKGTHLLRYPMLTSRPAHRPASLPGLLADLLARQHRQQLV